MSQKLKPCPDCGRPLSRQARACPNCGRPRPHKSRFGLFRAFMRGVRDGVAPALTAIVVFGVILFLFGRGCSADRAAERLRRAYGYGSEARQ